MLNDIQDAKDYLANRNMSVFDLDAISELLLRLGNPERDIKLIHVTGTNGKGSTSSYIVNILKESGYKVGSFSSPSVFYYNEIIRINDEPISDKDFLNIFNVVYNAISDMQKNNLRLPTKFEIETAMAFVYFKLKKTDIAVMEVGMGGDLDSTNVVNDTIIEIVTRISYDHMGILGKTLREIATHKSGIIKNNSQVITTGQDSEVIKVLNDKCNSTHSKLLIAGDGTIIGEDDLIQTIGYKGREYKTKLLGSYQMYNLPIAIECARALKRMGFDKISDSSISTGIENTVLMGRFEVIGSDPIFVLDGAHNDEASQMLRESIKRYFNGKKIIFLMGIFKDKDYKKIMSNTLDLASEVITFDWDNERMLKGEILKNEILHYMDNVKYVKTPDEAVKLALNEAERGDVIIAFGSLSHLKDIRNAYKGVNNG